LIAADRVTAAKILNDEDKEGWSRDDSAIYVDQRDDFKHKHSQKALEYNYKFMGFVALFVRKDLIADLHFNLIDFKVGVLQELVDD